MTRLRIALYTHSTNPRGGVVHTLELGDALARAGHDVTIHAPDPTGRGFFRQTAARHISIQAVPAPASLADMVTVRSAEIAAHIRAAPPFDIHHAQDSISANALADCVDSGDIRNFIRTVHHVDTFDDPRIAARQHRGIARAATCLCVSALWQQCLARQFNIQAAIVPNGVSLNRFNPETSPRDVRLRAELRLGEGPIYLAIGGIEERKNSIGILQAFERVRQTRPTAQLIIAGGASLLDHSTYQQKFHAELTRIGAGPHIILAGPVADADMPSLYRIADALVFPSTREGFGLVILEALACETPVVTSRIAPFTEYLTDHDCNFADPEDPGSIAAAMAAALTATSRAAASRARRTIAAAMGWDVSAARHLARYAQHRSLELHHA